MKVPLSWLRELVDITLPLDELVHRLNMSGTEVEDDALPVWRINGATTTGVKKPSLADRVIALNVSRNSGRQSG